MKATKLEQFFNHHTEKRQNRLTFWAFAFVNFSESQITKEDVKGVLFKEIDIRGEIKEGTIYLSTTTDGKKERAPNTEGIYVVVFEIIK